MNKSEQLIACLEGEIAKRDEELAACRVAVENCELFRARIAELEDDLKCAHSMLCEVSKSGMVLRTELAALKAQEPVLPCELDLESSFSCAEKEASLHAGVRDTFYFALIECLQKNKLYRAPAQKELSVVMPERKKAHNCEGIEFWKANGWNDCLDELASIYAAPVSEAKAQGVVMPDVNAAAKALCNRHAMICGFDADDQWKEFSQDFIADAETVLANARLTAAPVSSGDPEKCSYQDDPRSPAELSLAGCNCVRFGECNPHWPCKLHTPAAEAGASLIEWTKDAVEWGGALNYAAWEFVNECPEKSALLFNNTKGPLRAAIMKYAEIVSSHRAKGDSHDQ